MVLRLSGGISLGATVQTVLNLGMRMPEGRHMDMARSYDRCMIVSVCCDDKYKTGSRKYVLSGILSMFALYLMDSNSKFWVRRI
jgi:hypothetical protein